MAPIIGITTSGRNEKVVDSAYYQEYYTMPHLYVAAVRRAGGIPILLPPGETQIAELVATVDGIIFSGGGDIMPSVYGGNANHPHLVRQDSERDGFEIDLIRYMVSTKDTPALCICRGMQILNVALGGTMQEHIPDIKANDMHRNYNGFWTTHDVHVESDSKIGEIMQTATVKTYSGHHQAIKELAAGLMITATAEDTIIEGLELMNHPWMIGVQWHPEKSAGDDSTQQALFDALVQIARQGL
ncbi:MAG: gamma-glutamyl-gamma-aminobutyrate hydrolase family protein [Phototrophicaceae bacterium]